MPTREEMKRKAIRLIEIEKAMAIGMSYREVQLRFADQYSISDRQIRKDILVVQQRWATEAEAEGKGDLRRNQTRQLLKTIARKAMADKNYGAAVAAANRLMELDGLKTIKVEHSGQVGTEVKITMSDDEVDARIAVLQKALENSEEPVRH